MRRIKTYIIVIIILALAINLVILMPTWLLVLLCVYSFIVEIKEDKKRRNEI